MQKQDNRFHYCPPMEIVEWEFSGHDSRPHGMASAFSNPTYFRRRCRAILKKARRRVNDVVTNDENLRLMLMQDIEALDGECGRISRSNQNDMEIIAGLLTLIAHLLGWAHMDGKFYRTPIYHQSEGQRREDLAKWANLPLAAGLYEVHKRRQIVKQLLSSGDSHSTVALIMGLTASGVKALENAVHIDEMYQARCSERGERAGH